MNEPTTSQINHCLAETYKHVRQVGRNITLFVTELLHRADNHDNSKFNEPELSIFAANTEKLAQTKFGTPEYDALLQETKTAVSHHHSKNRHHPEHWPNGIEDMNLIDLVEMLADWKAATSRMKDGNIRKSIEINAQRYNMSPQLKRIFDNTVREFFKE